MKNLIKIPKEIAKSIGIIKYTTTDGRNCEINPFCSEQKTGEYLMDEDTYKKALEIPEVKVVFEKIDFNVLERIAKEEIDLKEEIK